MNLRRDALAAASRGEPEAAGEALARFHYRFVRLHPFRCANQSLAGTRPDGAKVAVLSAMRQIGRAHV